MKKALIVCSLALITTQVQARTIGEKINDTIDYTIHDLMPNQVRRLYETPSPLKIDHRIVYNSEVTLWGNLPADTRWVILQTRKKGSAEPAVENRIPVESPYFALHHFLRSGPATYYIAVYVSSGDGTERQTVPYSYFKVQNRDTRDMKFILPSPEIASDHREIVALAKELTAEFSSYLEKSKAIHDWIIRNIDYDVEAYASGAYHTNSFDALSALRSRKALCEGYSNLNAALHRAIGIPAKLITGEVALGNAAGEAGNAASGPAAGGGVAKHAWNEVFVNGAWMIQDTTWDAGYADLVNSSERRFVRKLRDDYFNPSPETFARTHRKQREEVR